MTNRDDPIRRAVRELLAGRRAEVCLRAGALVEQANPPAVVFPGAFNPLHAAHRQMAALAAERCGAEVEFEISVENVDKRPLTKPAVWQRAAQFAGGMLRLTRAATFTRKAALFPRATFVVGADTLRRIVDPRYYDNDERQCRFYLEAIVGLGCRFLVFGRQQGGDFITLDQLAMPTSLRAVCQCLSESEFRHDLSSTQLRGESAKPG